MAQRERLVKVTGAVVAVILLLLSFLLTGCGAKNNEGGGLVSAPAQQPSDQVGVGEDELDFDLTKEEDPEFDPSVEGSVEEPEPMYIEIDGYLYQLDPATLEPSDIPLDPVTKQPVEIQEQPDITEEYEEETSEDADEFVESPSAEEPTEDTKYPNTGIFTEDD